MTQDPYAARMYIDAHMDAPDSIAIAGGEAIVFTMRSPDHEHNEDSAVVIPVTPDHGVLALADGAGGHAGGGEASRLALEALQAAVASRDSTEQELRSAILNGFELANETVRGMGVGAGTTLAVVEIQGHWVRTYHVGDSGIVVVGQRGAVKARTVDHSPAGYGLEAGLMNEREAFRHEERDLLMNMVGDADMRIEMGPSLQLAARDTVLMASDGLFDNLVFDDIIRRVRKGRLDESVHGLAGASRKRMQGPPTGQPSKPDDLTVVAFRRTTPSR